ncbi:MAG TPA: acyltransferase, partial [Ilumatobacter sp.]|nr:acyltransferase [Ilumatobacter sp.]
MATAGDRMLQPMMGYQPGLDGLRAISVIAVICYHAGFVGVPGGFLGVEVFFVVSGFLITSLLIDERRSTGRVSLRQFWLRRARRLLPALVAMMLAVSVWAAVFGSAEQTSQLRRDLPWSIFYVANWGQIVGDVPYFQPGDPPLLRHLWSLAVEEQWYLLWPLAFVALTRSGPRSRLHAGLLSMLAIAVMAITWAIQRSAPALIVGGLFDGADRVNFNYLSTITR